MKRNQHPDERRSGLDLLEGAVHLVRSAPAGTLARYYGGTIPFVFAFLFFWVDMERSPFAGDHLADGAFAVAALFFWMKFCHAGFARRLREQLTATSERRWNFREQLRVFFSQAVLHSSGLFVLPISFLLVIPFPWAYAFYQSVTAVADSAADNLKQIRAARKQAGLAVWQNHSLVGLAVLLWFFILLNWASVVALLPLLVKMLFGIETPFTRNPIAMLNTTFLGIVVALTYLSADPIMKAAYVLRCFYAESLHSGEDLKAELKYFQMVRPCLAALLLGSTLFAVRGFAAPRQETLPAVATSPASQQLDRQIDEVIHQPKYTWRLPRGTVAQDQKQGLVSRFLAAITHFVRNVIRWIFRGIEALLRRMFSNIDSSSGGSLFGVKPSALLYLLLAAVIAALAIFLIRTRRPRRIVAPLVPVSVNEVPDINDDAVSADQLPEDDWIRLANELMERGEFRLAMRAFYLATLAHLARRGLLQIARFKSNRDYENEIRRRAHSVPTLLPLFGENILLFERIWYGLHAVDRELLLRFASNMDRIKSAA